jgi:hypothetical protein
VSPPEDSTLSVHSPFKAPQPTPAEHTPPREIPPIQVTLGLMHELDAAYALKRAKSGPHVPVFKPDEQPRQKLHLETPKIAGRRATLTKLPVGLTRSEHEADWHELNGLALGTRVAFVQTKLGTPHWGTVVESVIPGGIALAYRGRKPLGLTAELVSHYLERGAVFLV